MFSRTNSAPSLFDDLADDFGDSPGTRRPAKRLTQKITFWAINALVMPLVALCYLTISAEGLRQLMGIFSLRLYKLPVPGAGLLRQYDGWNRLDLSMLMGLLLFGAVTFIWIRIFSELMGFGQLAKSRKQNAALFYLLLVVVTIIVLGDCAIFYFGLEAKAASSWGETPKYVSVGATIIYMAGLALLGAWHADYHCAGKE